MGFGLVGCLLSQFIWIKGCRMDFSIYDVSSFPSLHKHISAEINSVLIRGIMAV